MVGICVARRLSYSCPSAFQIASHLNYADTFPAFAVSFHILSRYTIYKDHITLEDYEIHDGMGLELYYL